jgi:hypothetical protein
VRVLRDLRKFFGDRYDKFGPAMPDDDQGALDDFLILLNYVAMLGDYRALRATKARWMPSLDEVAFDAMVAEVVFSPLYLAPDVLGERIGLYDDKRTELKIRSIGGIGCTKAQRADRRNGKKAVKLKAKRAAKRALRPVSASAAKPWIDVGMSRSSWYANGKPLALDAGQNVTPNKLSLSAGGQVLSKQSQGAARSALTRSACGGHAAADLIQSPAVIAQERESAEADRCFAEMLKSPWNNPAVAALNSHNYLLDAPSSDMVEGRFANGGLLIDEAGNALDEADEAEVDEAEVDEAEVDEIEQPPPKARAARSYHEAIYGTAA